MTGTTTHPNFVAVARRAARLSQRDLRELCGLSQPAISHIETGMTTPRTVTKRALAAALGYSVEDLFPPDGRTTNAELRAWAKALKGKAPR